MKRIAVITSSAVILLSTHATFAQGISADVDATADTEGEVDADAEAEREPEPEPEPVAEPEPAPARVERNDDDEIEGDSDHDAVIGHFAVGYLGRQTLHYGVPGAPGGGYVPVVAPIIGVRYWFTDLVGLDAGVGFSFLGGRSTLTDEDDVRAAGHQAFLIHAGVPLNLADEGHFSFQVVPEANFGLVGTGDLDGDPDDDIEIRSTGTFFNIGARAGAEIHFGFMGIPKLSLQGSVGVYFQAETVRTKVDVDGDVIRATDTSTRVATTLGADPWDIFTSSISALYYF